MISAMLGRKIGMTRVFNEYGKVIPVTAITAGPCVVLAVTEKNIRLGFEDVKEKKIKKPQRGMFEKLNIAPKKVIREVEKGATDQELKVGDEIKSDIFQEGSFVDVIGTSIGKGFQGGVKRWNWNEAPKSHGSMAHRRPGSIGSSSDPSRVFKGRHMPGHMGNKRITVQNLKIVKVDVQNNIVLIKGQVPGHRDALVIIRHAKKKKIKKNVKK